jgi:GNAT superfamily N-acetyltransferase
MGQEKPALDEGLKTRFKIRWATISDAGGIALLCGQLGYPSSPEEVRLRMKSILTENEQAVFVAVQGRIELVGWVQVSLLRLVVLSPMAEVVGLIVKEGLRSQGIGLALLDRAETWAQERGLSMMMVHSNVIRERAHQFYTKTGYKLIKSQHVLMKKLSQPL